MRQIKKYSYLKGNSGHFEFLYFLRTTTVHYRILVILFYLESDRIFIN